MAVIQAGQTLSIAPGLTVVIFPPSNVYINGLATDGLGSVGVASWGPVNMPVIGLGNPAQVQAMYGPITNRPRDISTAADVYSKNFVQSMTFVRVTDATDVAAQLSLMDTAGTPVLGLKLTAKYTGIVGNTFTGAITTGTAVATYKLTLTRSGFVPEVWDNIPGTGAAFWANALSAVNNGIPGSAGPSQNFVATIGTSSAAPNITTTYAATGGTDGATGVTDTMMVGTDGLTRTGMYALRKTGVQVGNLIDCVTSTTWLAQAQFGLAEGIYFKGADTHGTSLTTAGTDLATAGVDAYSFSLAPGDFCWYADTVNGVNRSLSPATYLAAIQAATSPEQSILNKPIYGLIGTDRSNANNLYAQSEKELAVQNRLDYIANPSPGGNYFSSQTALNTSSNSGTNGDNYTRMTNYIAFTINAALGYVIGQLQTTAQRRNTRNTLNAFFNNMWKSTPQMIGDVNNPTTQPWSVILDASNNTSASVALGNEIAAVNVTYLSVVRRFIVNFQGGQGVVASVQPA
ncbi:MAG: hypothetical protein B7Z62_08910 [Deltaproteobacteria bacterium 37-65-8]|nr:MAG: hypothetical protein B7Z62_08910 [Deltaproteobacteria bacterium 37-65-8]